MSTPTVGTVAELRQAVAAARAQGLTVGLVPTMGALHEGHAWLIRAARRACDYVVVSIFVNPTQFGPQEDFHRYPRPLAADLEVSAQSGASLAFVPSVEEMYPRGFQTFVEVKDLQEGMEGASRPGHFRGVATVVLKLLLQILPDLAFFGQKDGQQSRVIQRLVRDLDVPVGIRIEPTQRAEDGLALSSRNAYLDAEQRRAAPGLYAALHEAELLLRSGIREAATVTERVRARLAAIPGAVLDYVSLVDLETLQPIDSVRGSVMVAAAVRFGTTRLIDNVWVTLPDLEP